MMTRRRTLVPLALLAPVAFAFAGCNSVQLPEGYAWSTSPETKNVVDPPRGSYRWGFDQSRINESRPATARDLTTYDFAAVLPRPDARPPYEPQYTAPAPGTPSTSPNDLRAQNTIGTPPDLFTALDPAPAGDVAVFTLPANDAPSVARGAFRAPATTEVRILGGSPTFTPAPTPAAPRTHTVVKGDNYWDLAKQYYGQGIRFKDIEAANPNQDPKRLQIGDTLIIPE